MIPDLGRIEKLLEDNKKVTKNLNDAWEKNLASTSKIKNGIDRFFSELGIAEQRCDEMEKIVQLNCDFVLVPVRVARHECFIRQD